MSGIPELGGAHTTKTKSSIVGHSYLILLIVTTIEAS